MQGDPPMPSLWGRIPEQSKILFNSQMMTSIRGIVRGREALVYCISHLPFPCPPGDYLLAGDVPDDMAFLTSNAVADATEEQQRILDEIEWSEKYPGEVASYVEHGKSPSWVLWGKITEQNKELIGSRTVVFIRAIVKGRESLVIGAPDLFGFHKCFLKAEDVPDDMAFLTGSSVEDATEDQQRILDETEWLEKDPRRGDR